VQGDGRLQENIFKSEDGCDQRHEFVSNLAVRTTLAEQWC
jgi:hypothetical protein